jgi:hypothetical protein
MGSTVSGEQRAKVFGIGLNKTGTLSLHEALETLGYESLHHGGLETMNLVERAIEERMPMLTYIDPRYNAFSDVFGLTYDFYLADVQYPGSRFILTVRSLESWLESRRRHVERNQRAAAAGEYTDGFVDVDIEAWTTEYVRHDALVRSYFADRPGDLLVFDLIGGDGWEPLCEFLRQPVPEESFPWRNESQPWTLPPARSESELAQ